MTEQEIAVFMEHLRYLANTPTVDTVISNHARGILVRVATKTGSIQG